MFNINLKIPAKALLFGEYGVLYNGKALACALPQYFFEIEVSSRDLTAGSSLIHIESDFFENGKEEFFLEDSEVSSSFFQGLLKPWAKYLKTSHLIIKIKKSFPPNLGFGSSSAIIAGVSYALFILVHKKIPEFENEFLWKQIRKSLRNIQGKGSGYDIGVQLASLLSPKKKSPTYYIYQNLKESVVPHITSWVPSHALSKKMGCFIKTNIYSDTKKSVKKFSRLNKKKKFFFANEHSQIAENFLQSPNLSTLKKCMNESLTLAKKQGIHVPTLLSKKLEEQNIPFKTMGSGFGDCLWVLNSKEINEKDIIFDFTH